MIVSQKIIDRAVDFIKEKSSPEKIYLFGSYARGNPTENSDLDFFIIQNTNLPKHKRTSILYSPDKTKTIGAPIGIDFIIYTPHEFEKYKKNPNTIAGEVLATGKLIYERESR